MLCCLSSFGASSKQHLPGFVESADALKAKGVDTIACLSVNDAFVMGAWGQVRTRESFRAQVPVPYVLKLWLHAIAPKEAPRCGGYAGALTCTPNWHLLLCNASLPPPCTD